MLLAARRVPQAWAEKLRTVPHLIVLLCAACMLQQGQWATLGATLGLWMMHQMGQQEESTSATPAAGASKTQCNMGGSTASGAQAATHKQGERSAKAQEAKQQQQQPAAAQPEHGEASTTLPAVATGTNLPQTTTCPASFSDLPLHLQTLVLAWAGAPLNTCRASKAILTDTTLLPTWLVAGVKRPVLAAAHKGLWQVCCQLLSSGCRATPVDLRFALVKAAAAGRAQVVSCLIDAGACTVPEGTSASEVREATSLVFTEAAQNGFVDVCRVMLEKQVVKDQGILRGALLAAADNSDLCRSEQVLALLLEAGADANAGLRHFDAFNTPLGKAVFHQNIKAAQLLLKHGASVRCTSSGWGTSALEYAASWCERPDMVRLLIKHGARQGREAAIKKAASEGKWDVVQVLMDLSP